MKQFAGDIRPRAIRAGDKKPHHFGDRKPIHSGDRRPTGL